MTNFRRWQNYTHHYECSIQECPNKRCAYHKVVVKDKEKESEKARDEQINHLKDELVKSSLYHPLKMISSSPSRIKLGKPKWYSPNGQALDVKDRFLPKEYYYRVSSKDPKVQIHAWPFCPIREDKAETQSSSNK